ncbi:hypothetical protein NC651_000079 [Populus alba x Populus x berolinensis]|nr:hypothetical protein NC651_000079 [Populus alba x Populus x berolinensis]
MRFFFYHICREQSYLQYCILEPYINKVRALSLSYNRIMLATSFIHILWFTYLSTKKIRDLEVLCNACGLQTSADDLGNKSLPTKQTTFLLSQGRVPKLTTSRCSLKIATIAEQAFIKPWPSKLWLQLSSYSQELVDGQCQYMSLQTAFQQKL